MEWQRQTHRQRQRETSRQRDRQTDRQDGRRKDRHVDRQTDRQIAGRETTTTRRRPFRQHLAARDERSIPEISAAINTRLLMIIMITSIMYSAKVVTMRTCSADQVSQFRMIRFGRSSFPRLPLLGFDRDDRRTHGCGRGREY